MAFDTNRITKQQLRSQICSYAKSVGVNKVIFNNRGKYICGSFNSTNNVIYICSKQTKKQMLNTLFHELAHFYAVLNKKWIKFHFNLYKNPNPDRLFVIENKIDKIGKNLWNQHVNKKLWGNYKYFYLKSKKHKITTLFTNLK